MAHDVIYNRFSLVYDELMQGVDYDAWATYLDDLLRARGVGEGGLVLECACGTGAVTTRLSQRGYRMVGSDQSGSMLERAQENARRQGLRIPFVQQDMRTIQAHRLADAVICACDGVNYLTRVADVRAFLHNAHAALKEGGALLFDVSSAHKLAHTLGCNTFGEASDRCVYLWRNQFDENSRLLEMQLTFFIREGEGYARFDETHIQRAHTQEELTRLLHETGFTDVEAYGAFTRDAPSPESERIQFVACKNT